MISALNRSSVLVGLQVQGFKTEHYSIVLPRSKHCSAELKREASVCCVDARQVYAMCTISTLNGRSGLQRFKHRKVIKIHNGVN